MADFGVAAADIEARVSGLAFDANTTPTLTAVGAMIVDETARVSAVVRARGTDPDALVSGDEGYHLARLISIRNVASEVLVVQGAVEEADMHRRSAADLERQLIDRVASLGDSAPTDEPSRGVPLIGTVDRSGTLAGGGW